MQVRIKQSTLPALLMCYTVLDDILRFQKLQHIVLLGADIQRTLHENTLNTSNHILKVNFTAKVNKQYINPNKTL